MEHEKRARRAEEAVFNSRLFCSNRSCDYYQITNEQIHALVANGRHGTQEEPQELKRQAYAKKFIALA